MDAMQTKPDLVIRNGTILDGGGGEPFKADVAIADGRIIAIGVVEQAGERELDATGLLVTPGFVDIHTHYDGQAIWSDRLNPSSSHGVTTAVLGNCGVGFAPCRPADHDLLIRVMEGVEDIPGVVMAEGLSWNWETFPQYLDALEARHRDIDVAVYLPHSPVRVYVMGERGANREAATPEDLTKMREIAREAVAAGAIGFATSRVVVHRTADGAAIPSFQAAREELEEIGSGMADAGGGIIQLVPDLPTAEGWIPELQRMVEIGRATGRPITFTLGAGNSGPPIWRDALKLLHAARAEGISIAAQIFPRPVGLIAGFNLSTNPFCLTPTYKTLAQLPIEEKIERLRDPEIRARIIAEKPEQGHPLAVMGRSFDWMFPLTEPPNYEPALQDSIGAQARALGKSPEELAYDHLLTANGHAMLLVALGNFPNGSLDDLAELIGDDAVVLGLGDGGAHYGMICDASYPTFMLSHWARDRKGLKIALPAVIKSLTSDPAGVVGLKDRGRIAVGYKADINVIDLERLTLHAPKVVFDLPAGGRRLDQSATGYTATIVAGEIISTNGTPTGHLPGRLVRGARRQPMEQAA